MLVDELLPVFSQTKVKQVLWQGHGPLPLQLAAEDDPPSAPWEDRAPTLFFRGSSTGGFIADTTNFASMHQQRLVAAASGDPRMDVAFGN